jgi:hypothetical protein
LVAHHRAGFIYHRRKIKGVRADKRGKQVIALWAIGVILAASGFAMVIVATLEGRVVSPYLVWIPIAAGIPLALASQALNRGRPTIWRMLRSKDHP